MMNSDIREQAAQKVKAIVAELDPTLIKSRFDEPIDLAVRQFIHKAGCPISPKEFHRIITEFVLHIYDTSFNARWMASIEPLGLVMELLETHYNGAYGRGYIAAALDANDTGEGGMDAVLTQLAEIIKDIERQKYVNAVFAVHINPADWRLKCEIVRILLAYYRPFLPEQLRICKPWELVHEIPFLMYRYIGTDSALQELLCYPENSWKR
ncbi:MAG: hypothetical protein JW828_15395 [Sedimentisphaerales bacterium]|nr:hypothetical protein [Sedimentisphaerales bacterium]